MPGGDGVSWTTGTQTEALASSSAVSGASDSFTSAQYIGATTGAAYLPANFWLPTYGVGKSLLVKAFGVMGCTSTPNITIGISANTSQGTYNPSDIFATTGAVACPASGSNMPWELEVLISCAGTGSSGSLLADGQFTLAATSTTQYVYRCSSSTANPNTAATINTENAWYVELFAAFSSSSSSNTITVYQSAVLGLN